MKALKKLRKQMLNRGPGQGMEYIICAINCVLMNPKYPELTKLWLQNELDNFDAKLKNHG